MKILWRFRATPNRVGEFRRIYGNNGEWAKLFARSAGYRGTELLQDVSDPVRFVTIDSWTSREALERFRAEFAGEYQALDKECEALTEEEAFIGSFDEAKF